MCGVVVSVVICGIVINRVIYLINVCRVIVEYVKCGEYCDGC